MRRTLTALLLLAAATTPALAQEQTHAFRGARIYPVAASPIDDGVLVVRGGKILAVGRKDQVQIPQDAVVHDVPGKVIIPGLIDTHSHIGDGSGGDASSPIHPSVRVLDVIDARDDGIRRAQAGGITTANVMPGSGHLMSGQTVYLKLRDGRIIDDLVFCEDLQKEICGGIKMANGTNSRRDPPFPGTRAKSAALVREKFIRAQEYREKVRQAKGDASKMPARDLEMEALVQVLDGQRKVHHHTHRADDILTVLRLADEFGFKVVLHHVSEAWKVADELAAAGVPSSIIILDSPGGKMEVVDLRMENGVALERAGAAVAFHTDDPITDSRWFLRSAALGVRAGMSEQKALEALTLAGAKMLDLQDRVGSLETGKDADFVILSGNPLSAYTLVEQTWVEGSRVFDRSNPDDRKDAVGGYGAFRPGSAHDHHAGMEGH